MAPPKTKWDKIECSDSEEEQKPDEDDKILADLPPELPLGLSLVLAARNGTANVLEALLKKRVDANSEDPHGKSALLLAVMGGSGNRECIELLLKHGADVNRETTGAAGGTALGQAAASGPVELLEAMMDAGSPAAEIRGRALVAASAVGNRATSLALLHGKAALVADAMNLKGEQDGRSALHNWATKGSAELVQKLLAAGAAASLRDHDGETPLISAARGGSAACATLLLDAGADVNEFGKNGHTALVEAADLKSEDEASAMAEVLLARGASVAHMEVPYAPSPLAHACSSGKQRLVVRLLEARADASAADGAGRMPLPCAAACGSMPMCEALLAAGASVNGRGKSGIKRQEALDAPGVTALHIAAAKGNVALLQLLLDHKADTEAADERDCTPLMTAARIGNTQMLEALLKAGAVVDARQEGTLKTALIFAASNGFEEALELLLKAGADKEARMDTGTSALHAAAANNHAGVCRKLLAAGVSAKLEGAAGKTASQIAAGTGNKELSEELARAE